MKLELKHLAPYLPYKLKGNYEVSEVVPSAKFELRNKELRTDNIDFFLNYAKPILRPLSDITKKIDYIKYGKRVLINDHVNIMKLHDDKKEYKSLSDIYFYYGNVTDLSEILETFNSLFELHFDVFGLIEKGLAIDINSLPQSLE